MDLSIIIVSWNTRELLELCLSSIYANQPSFEFETRVVDNASSDDSVQMIQTRFPQVKLHCNNDNVGFAHANNQAIQESAGRLVLLLNPDTEVKPNALETLIRFMDEHPKIGASGPLTLNPNETLQTSCYPLPTLSREIWRLLHLDQFQPYGSYKMTYWRQDEPREVEALLGACLMLRREALDQIGLLDEDYFIYSEEIDLCYRLRQAGWNIFWVPEAKIIHYGGQSTQQVAAKMFLHLYRGKLLYFRKHYGTTTALIYKFILFFTAIVRLILIPIVWVTKPLYRRQYVTLATNYRRLITTLPSM